MSKKRQVFIGLILFGIVLNVMIMMLAKPSGDVTYKLKMDVTCDKEQEYQLYFSKTGEWTEADSAKVKYKDAGSEKTLEFAIPSTSSYIRLDLGDKAATHEIGQCYLEYKDARLDIEDTLFYNAPAKQMILNIENNGNNLNVVTDGNDAYYVLDLRKIDMHGVALEQQKTSNFMMNIARCALIDIILLFCIIYFDRLIAIPVEVYNNRTLVKRLSINDFKTRYSSNYLGIFWAFVQPVITVLVYSFVFQVGFRSPAVVNCPFVLWLLCGLVPWFYFSDALNGGASSMIEYSYLVKKLVFNISILPVVKVISNLFVHVFFLAVTILLFACFGYFPDIYTLQVLYYSFAMTVFILALSYATSAIMVFFRDLGQIIGIFLSIGIWMTPIMWVYTMVPGKFQWVLKINPIFYIVQGYRESLIDKVWFWDNLNQTIFFWGTTILLFGFGVFMFNRLKVHFADVL